MPRKLLSTLLVAVMLLSLAPAGFAQEIRIIEPEGEYNAMGWDADDSACIDGAEIHVNPLYRDVLPAEELADELNAPLPAAASSSCSTLEEAAAIIRAGMKARENSISVNYSGSESFDTDKVLALAVAHTGLPTEGDYLKFQYGGWRLSALGGEYRFQFTYYTDAEQEAELDAAIDELLAGLNLNGKSEYEKTRAVYDFVCANTVYDKTNLNNSSYKLKFTAYAAMINQTAVCQGYSVLLYRLLLTLGVDSRIVTSADHAWNIVRLGDLYYNADSTWDAGNAGNYSWFLKCMDHFPNHDRETPYLEEEFLTAYPMSPTDYVVGDSPITLERDEVTLYVGGEAATVRFTVDDRFEFSGLSFSYPNSGFVEVSGTYSSVTITPLQVGSGIVSVLLKDDSKNTIAKASIYVTVLEAQPEPHGNVTVTITDHTKGAAAASLKSNTGYSGKETFTVTSTDDKAVLVAVKDGDTYTVLECTTDENGVHSYTVNMDKDMEIILALKGDVTLDGKVALKDNLSLKKHIAGTEVLSGLPFLVGDVDSNGEIKLKDTLAVKKVIAGTSVFAW